MHYVTLINKTMKIQNIGNKSILELISNAMQMCGGRTGFRPERFIKNMGEHPEMIWCVRVPLYNVTIDDVTGLLNISDN